MNRDYVLAKCYLHAVLPLIEEVVEYDAEAKKIVKDWKGTIQFSCPGGFGEYLEFEDGKARAYRGTTSWPTVALWFFSPKEMVKLFTNEGFTLPIPWKGLMNLNMLKGFTELSKRLSYYLETPLEELPKEHMPFVIKLKLYTMVRAIKEVGENDAHVASTTAKLPNGIAEFKVLKDGPAAHLRVRNGVIFPEVGSATNPNVVMEIADLDVANALLNDELDTMAALVTGELKIKGNIMLIDGMNAILDRIPYYLA